MSVQSAQGQGQKYMDVLLNRKQHGCCFAVTRTLPILKRHFATDIEVR